MLDLYHNNYKIIISYTKNFDYDNIIKHINDNNYQDILILENENFISNDIDNFQNIYYHCLNVYNALSFVTTQYVFKLRSDEFFYDLNVFFEYILSNNKITKIIVSDIFFRKSNCIPYHISDHYMFCDINIFKKAFYKLKQILEKKDPFVYNLFNQNIKNAEQKITISILLIFEENIDFSIDNSNLLLNKYFEIYKATNFKKFNYSYDRQICDNYRYFNEITDCSDHIL
jgi:hypothetical protein